MEEIETVEELLLFSPKDEKEQKERVGALIAATLAELGTLKRTHSIAILKRALSYVSFNEDLLLSRFLTPEVADPNDTK